VAEIFLPFCRFLGLRQTADRQRQNGRKAVKSRVRILCEIVCVRLFWNEMLLVTRLTYRIVPCRGTLKRAKKILKWPLSNELNGSHESFG
jgi:hypothetical protein